MPAPTSHDRRATGSPVRPLWLAVGGLWGAIAFLGSSPALASANAPAAPVFVAAAPGGFDALLGPQTSLVDVYYGGKPVGTAMAEYRPGLIRFTEPEALIKLVPKLRNTEAVLRVLREDLPTNADRACSDETNGRCHRMETTTVAVIFDEANFRADLFFNPTYLDVTAPLVSRYIPAPDKSPSLAASLGGAFSGASQGDASYDLQGRVVANYRNAYVSAEVTQSSAIGFQVQSLAAAVDRGPLRAQAGLLVSPGVDLIGQGRFYGAALSTQTDTLANRDQISSTPMLLYLANRAQVDVLRNGRLLSSKLYEAGNQLIDTSNLPDGAYSVTLRIREVGGFTHEETRAFNKSRTLPPLGLPQFFVGAGVLAQDYGAGFPKTSGLLVEGGYARRLSQSAAFDLTTALVGSRLLGEAGLTYLGGAGLQVRAASIASSDGGVGFIFKTSIGVGSASSLAIDARQGWSARPMQSKPSTVLSEPDQTFQQNEFGLGLAGSQFSANYTVTFRGAQIGLVGSYASAPWAKSSHTFGPTLDVPFSIAGTKLRFLANAAETERGLQAYFGLRLQFNRGRVAVYGDAGVSSMADGVGRRELGPSAELTASASRNDEQWGEMSGSANITHMQDRDAVELTSQLRGDHGDFNAQVDHDISGAHGETHFSAGFLVGAVLTPSHAALGSASGGDSGVIVEVQGAPKGSEFEVLVNNAPRARIRAGERLPIMLPAYRMYAVRLTPRGADTLDFDTTVRQVSLYPGTVTALTWTAEKVVEVFGRVLDEQDHPVAQARVQGGRYPGLTDDNGYFQVSLTKDSTLRFERPRYPACQVAVTGVAAANNHISLGAQKCYALTFAQGEHPMTVAMATHAISP